MDPTPEVEQLHRNCPGSRNHEGKQKKRRLALWMIPLVGLASLIWFLVRVVPKPSRATYPCQQAAMPLASGFVLWLIGVLASLHAFRKGRQWIGRKRIGIACACLAIAAAIGAVVFVIVPEPSAMANNPTPNAPIGIAKGIHPGRVAWAYDPGATNWAGPGNGHWWESSHTRQAAVDEMMSDVLQSVSGKNSDREAWNAIFQSFNKERGSGNSGYRKGEKIAVKVNFVGCIVGSGGSVDPKSYNMVRNPDYMNTSPQAIAALLRQLVRVAGVNQADITLGDPLALFPNEYYEMLHRDFPDVRYLDHDGGTAEHVRTRVQPSSVPLYWSARPTGVTQDYVPTAYAEAKYFINLANLKSHTSGGVTLCAKNHFGSLIRRPPEKGYYNMHDTLARPRAGMGHYRDLVDLMGHAHTGGKTLIYIIDGLYSGVHPIENSPRKWNLSPFNGNWSSSLLASQDPVAIDSVAFDFLWAEWNNFPHMPGADDYLHEAALADNPPSGTFYDPNHAVNTTRLPSLGVHEHWNNPQERKYTRNLGLGQGIELIQIGAGGKKG